MVGDIKHKEMLIMTPIESAATTVQRKVLDGRSITADEFMLVTVYMQEQREKRVRVALESMRFGVGAMRTELAVVKALTP